MNSLTDNTSKYTGTKSTLSRLIHEYYDRFRPFSDHLQGLVHLTSKYKTQTNFEIGLILLVFICCMSVRYRIFILCN